MQNKFQNVGPPYRPMLSGAVEIFIKTMQVFSGLAKYHFNEKYDLRNLVNGFIMYYTIRSRAQLGLLFI